VTIGYNHTAASAMLTTRLEFSAPLSRKRFLFSIQALYTSSSLCYKNGADIAKRIVG
jgi:hypothetical protein